MNIYLAGCKDIMRIIDDEYLSNGKINLNILESFYYQNDTVAKAIPYLKHFILDSGAFTFFSSKPSSLRWEEYVEKYAQYIKENNVELFMELDIDPLIGYDGVLKLRERLERLVSKPCIPVWHRNRGKDDFVRMCQQYDYVALGGIAIKEIKRSEYQYFPFFINTAHKYGAKIHGLGFTSIEGLKKYHFDSVDSTTWMSGQRFGEVHKFNGRTMVRYIAPKGHRLTNTRGAILNNFKEWVKFCDYAEKNL